MMWTLVKSVVALAAAFLLIRQCRKPAWLPGRLFLSGMNTSHGPLTAWGLKHVEVKRDFTILDVGCGGGQTVHTLAAAAIDGKVYGVDYSPTSVAATKSKNAGAIAAGRVDVRDGSVSKLPFPDGMFDLVTAVETHYYWPDLVADMREVLRTLKPGGTFVLIAEAYKGGGALEVPTGLVMKLVGGRLLSANEHRELLTQAGFADVALFEEKSKGWICGVGKRPS
jgi:SAM-dependent methyltransferase